MAMISKNAKQPMEGMASASMPSMTADGSNGPNVTGGEKGPRLNERRRSKSWWRLSHW